MSGLRGLGFWVGRVVVRGLGAQLGKGLMGVIVVFMGIFFSFVFK